MAEEVRVGEEGIKKMTVAEFRELGYLQELNRKFLHPLGLALEVRLSPDGHERFSNEVWDYRDDPEGLIYGPDIIDVEKAQRIHNESVVKQHTRMQRLGFIIQPEA